MKPSFRAILVFICLLCCSSIFANGQENPLPFRAAIELALKNSATSAIARADLQRARANYQQARDLFVPQVTLGSGLAYSNGFPLSLEGAAPSIFNVNTQSFLFNPAQRQFIKAAKGEVSTTEAQNADRRNDVIMETALAYNQLDLLQSSFNVQKEQQEFAAKVEEIVGQRVQAGLD